MTEPQLQAMVAKLELLIEQHRSMRTDLLKTLASQRQALDLLAIAELRLLEAHVSLSKQTVSAARRRGKESSVIGELPHEIVARIAGNEMDSRHNPLDRLLDS